MGPLILLLLMQKTFSFYRNLHKKSFIILFLALSLFAIYEPNTAHSQEQSIFDWFFSFMSDEKTTYVDNITYLENQNEYLNDQINDLNAKNNKLNNQINDLYLENEKLSNDMSYWSFQNKQLENDKTRLKNIITSMEKEREEISDNIEIFQKELESYMNMYEETAESERLNFVNQLTDKYKIFIHDGKINWNVQDGSNNPYTWVIPILSYEDAIRYNDDYSTRKIRDGNNQIYKIAKLEPFVDRVFTKVIDNVWLNSNSNNDFVYNVWYIVNQLTVYSTEIGEYPRYSVETLSRGGGDCEDMAILIVDMLRSSKHTKNWDIQFMIVDSNNLDSPITPNHVIIKIAHPEIDGFYYLEPTAKTWDAAMQHNGKFISGWVESI